ARITAPGNDVTLVGISAMQPECLKAHHYLAEVGIEAEVIDPVWLSPLDLDTIEASVARTGRLLVVDNGWTCCGASAEIVAAISERGAGSPLRVRRLGFAPTPCPTTSALEAHYYPTGAAIAAAARDLVEGRTTGWRPERRPDLEAAATFKGPF
ncbi:MAG: transketolase C-terminal domain-containing protein, partial [Gemmataceae bacterium]